MRSTAGLPNSWPSRRLAELIPGADHYGPPQGNPPVAKVFAGQKLVGYAFVNADWVNSTGYSGQPIQILVGLTTEGKIAGARLMAHHEPIVLIGIPPERIAKFIQGYVGRDVLKLSHEAPSERPTVDIVSGATVTVTVIAESMVRSAIRVARAEGMGGPAQAEATAAREIDPSHEAPADWIGLVGDGSVRHLSLRSAMSRRRSSARAIKMRSTTPKPPIRRRRSSTCMSPPSPSRRSASACSATPASRRCRRASSRGSRRS